MPRKPIDLPIIPGVSFDMQRTIDMLRDSLEHAHELIGLQAARVAALPPPLTLDQIQQALAATGSHPLPTADLLNTNPPPTTPIPPPSAQGTGNDPNPATNPILPDLSNVVFIDDAGVGGWAQTAVLSVSFPSSGTIRLDSDKKAVWPAGFPLGGSGTADELNANAWVFVFRGTAWYASTFDWMRPNQTDKDTSNLGLPDFATKPPINNFSATSGESYGWMVSGLARNAVRNVLERSNIVMATFP